jgi:hypothetical protein
MRLVCPLQRPGENLKLHDIIGAIIFALQRLEQELEADIFVTAIARAKDQLFIEAMGGEDVFHLDPVKWDVWIRRWFDDAGRFSIIAPASPDVNGRVKVSQRAAQNVATLGLARLPLE